MLPSQFHEGFVGALDDPLAGDVDPGTGGHLAEHEKPLTVEFMKMFPGRPVGDEVGIGNQHPRCVRMSFENSHRFSGLNQERLVVLQALEGFDDPVIAVPVAGRTSDPSVDDEVFRFFRDFRVKVVHQHPHRCLGEPALATELGSSWRTDAAFRIITDRFSHGYPWLNVCWID